MLNEFAWTYLQADSIVLTIVAFAFIWLGGLAGMVWPKGAEVLNRAPYFALFGLTSLGFSVAQLMWMGAGAAIVGGWLWLLAMIDTVTAMIAGYIMVTLGRARSRDMRGDPGLGFLSVVPFANLWLLFAPGRAAPEAVTPVSPLFAGAAGVVVGLVTTVAARMLDSASEELVVAAITARVETPEGGAAIYDLRIRTAGLAAVLRDEAAAVGTPLPQGGGVTLIKVTADGAILRFYYDLAAGLVVDQAEAGAALRATACADAVQRVLVDHGARLEFTYRDTQGKVTTIAVASVDCGI